MLCQRLPNQLDNGSGQGHSHLVRENMKRYEKKSQAVPTVYGDKIIGVLQKVGISFK